MQREASAQLCLGLWQIHEFTGYSLRKKSATVKLQLKLSAFYGDVFFDLRYLLFRQRKEGDILFDSAAATNGQSSSSNNTIVLNGNTIAVAAAAAAAAGQQSLVKSWVCQSTQ